MVPVSIPIEARSLEQDASALQFQRFERVRARLDARRRYRLILATKLVTGLLAVGVVVFTALRLTSFEREGLVRAPAPVATVTPRPTPVPVETLTPSPAPAPAETLTLTPTPAATVTATPTPAPAPAERLTPPAHSGVRQRPTVMPPVRHVDGVKRPATHPPGRQVNADPRERPRSDRQAVGAGAPSQSEQQKVDLAVPTAAIDWLLKTPRPGATTASEIFRPSREEPRR